MEPRRRLVYTKGHLEEVEPKPSSLAGLRLKDVPPDDVDEDILKVYDTDEEEEHSPKVPRGYYRLPSKYWTDGMIFLTVCVVTGLFLYLVHFYCLKQLTRLKEDLNMHEVKTKPDVENWWHNALVYHIYPQSYYDSDGDGVGDIKGIIKKISNLEFMKVTAVLVSSMFKSPMVDQGRDVSDFMMIDPVYGTMADFELMVQEFHTRGIKVILEMIPNHTSDKHKWFQESRKGGSTNKYTNFYVWHKGKSLANGTVIPPNNWVSRYGGSAWTLDDVRQEFYLHQFHRSMPDINHRDPHLRDEMLKIWDLWLSKGIDGVMMDAVNAIFETEELELDEPESELPGILPIQYEYLDHVYTDDQPEIHEWMASYREHLDRYAIKHKKKVFLSVDVLDPVVGNVMHYFYTGPDAPMGYLLTYAGKDCDARCFLAIIDQWLQDLPDGKPCFWVASSSEVGRLSSKKGPMYKGALALMHLLLPGSAVVYYGDEMGMTHSDISWQDTVDAKAKNYGQALFKQYTRDPWRTPMQWNGEKNAGFTTAEKPWLPVNPDYVNNNAYKLELDAEGSMNIYRTYIKLGHLRQEPAFHYGRLQYALNNDHLLSFLRFAKDHTPYLVAVNLGTADITEDFTLTVGMEFGKVALAVGPEGGHHSIKIGTEMDLTKVSLKPGEGLVVALY